MITTSNYITNLLNFLFKMKDITNVTLDQFHLVACYYHHF
jgi:hypothetical protein